MMSGSDRKINVKSNYIAFGCCVTALFLMVYAFYRSTLSEVNQQSSKPHFICLFLGLLLYAAGHELYRKLRAEHILRQLLIFQTVVFVAVAAFSVLGIQDLVQNNRTRYLVSLGMIVLVCGFCSLRTFLDASFKQVWKPAKGALAAWARTHKYLLLLLAVFLVLTLLQCGTHPKWDGCFLYEYLYDMGIHQFFDWEALALYAHVSTAYCGLNIMFGRLAGDLFIGMSIANVGLYLASVAAVYGIIKRILPERSDGEYTLLTSVYAMSPFVLGLANYNFWDEWVIALFPIVIYFAMTKQWVYHFIFAWIICFTKEPAVIAYAFYCAGLVLTDWVSVRKEPLGTKLLRLVSTKQYWGMLSIGLTWLFVFTALPSWSGVGAFTLDKAYTWNKMKVLAVLNFHWVLVLAAVIVVLWAMVRNRKLFGQLFPLLLSEAAFVLFSCLYNTVNHPRYIDTHVDILAIVAIVALGSIGHKAVRYVLCTLVTVLLLVSNYRTVDPLTLKLFPVQKVGDAVMISTSAEALSDSVVYNQQYLGFEKVMSLALEDVVQEDNAVMVFPLVNGVSFCFDGIYLFSGADEECVHEQKYSMDKHRRVLFGDGDDSVITFLACNLSTEGDINKILDGREGYFFCLPETGRDIYQKIAAETEILGEEDFSYGGWTMTRVRFCEK